MTTVAQQGDRLRATIQQALQGKGGNFFVSGWGSDLTEVIARALEHEMEHDQIWVVEVPSRVDGTYVFLDHDDAERFARLVGEPVREETLIGHDSACSLIEAEEPA